LFACLILFDTLRNGTIVVTKPQLALLQDAAPNVASSLLQVKLGDLLLIKSQRTGTMYYRAISLSQYIQDMSKSSSSASNSLSSNGSSSYNIRNSIIVANNVSTGSAASGGNCMIGIVSHEQVTIFGSCLSDSEQQQQSTTTPTTPTITSPRSSLMDVLAEEQQIMQQAASSGNSYKLEIMELAGMDSLLGMCAQVSKMAQVRTTIFHVTICVFVVL